MKTKLYNLELQIGSIAILAAIVPLLLLRTTFLNITKSYQSYDNASPFNYSERLLKTVGELVEVPKGEKPQILTVADVNKLSDTPFKKIAKNGDELLIYQKAQRAILFRPSTNQIIADTALTSTFH